MEFKYKDQTVEFFQVTVIALDPGWFQICHLLIIYDFKGGSKGIYNLFHYIIYE